MRLTSWTRTFKAGKYHVFLLAVRQLTLPEQEPSLSTASSD